MAVIIRRTYSVPERLTLFTACAVAAGAIYPAVVAHTGGQGVPCPLRAITGIPCPFCGLTTATVAIAHGQWLAAARASPLDCAVVALAAATAPALLGRLAGLLPPPVTAPAAKRRIITRVVSAIVALNWLFELLRFGIL